MSTHLLIKQPLYLFIDLYIIYIIITLSWILANLVLLRMDLNKKKCLVRKCYKVLTFCCLELIRQATKFEKIDFFLILWDRV